MNPITRKRFLQTTALALAGTVIQPSFAAGKKATRLSFSTLGCPDWTLPQIIAFATANGYTGIEVRGIKRQMDLTQVPEFATAEERQKTLAQMKQNGLRFVNLGSSATLHFAEGAEREKAIAEGKQFIDLAQGLRCPYVRVFPNLFPKDRDKKETIALISSGLRQLGDYAAGKGVTVLMETHGDVVFIEDIKAIMQGAAHKSVGLVWDPANMWTITKEFPADAYAQLKRYIHHTHIKDARLKDGKLEYTLLGKGEVPIFEAVNVLRKGGYKGYYSFEWEKLWHPELAEPELALADYPVAMKKIR